MPNDNTTEDPKDCIAYRYSSNEILKSIMPGGQPWKYKNPTSGQNMRDLDMQTKVRLWHLCKALKLDSSMNNWGTCHKILGIPCDTKSINTIQKSSGIYNWWNDLRNSSEYSNQLHPYHHPIVKSMGKRTNKSSSRISIYKAIEICREIKKFQAINYPHLGEQFKVCVPYYMANVDKWWYNKLSDELKCFVENITALFHNITSIGSSRSEILSILQHEGGLEIERREANSNFMKENKAYGVTQFEGQNNQYVMNATAIVVFLDYGKISMEDIMTNLKLGGGTRRKVEVYPRMTTTLQQYTEYENNDIVKAFVCAMSILADVEAEMGRVGVENKDKLNKEWLSRDGYYSKIFGKEMQRRLGEVGKKCMGGDLCNCEGLGLFIEMLCELHHKDEDAEKAKKKIKNRDNSVKQPNEYSEEDHDDQRKHVEPVCKFGHRMLGHRTNGKSSRKKIHTLIRDHIVLSKNEGECFSSGTQATLYNMRAFDSHHLAWDCYMKFGDVILATKKFSNLSLIVLNATSYEDLIENLFPEIIITSLTDTRIHKIIHFLLDKPELRSDLGIEFPFELKEIDGHKVLEYNGDKDTSEIEKLGKGKYELPSATTVLGVSIYFLLIFHTF